MIVGDVEFEEAFAQLIPVEALRLALTEPKILQEFWND